MKKLTILGLLLISTCTSFAQLKGEYINVIGEARVYATPELMIVNIPFEVESKSYSECSEMLISRYNQMLSSLTKNGFKKDKIKSSGLSISEKYTWIRNERKKEGFQGRIQMEVEEVYTKEVLNNLMRALKNDKYDYGYNLSFKLSEQQKDALLAKTIDIAVDDAKNKAELLANSLGVILSKIKEINYGISESTHTPLLREKALYAAESSNQSNELSLEAKPQQITNTVQITWKIKQ